MPTLPPTFTLIFFYLPPTTHNKKVVSPLEKHKCLYEVLRVPVRGPESANIEGLLTCGLSTCLPPRPAYLPACRYLLGVTDEERQKRREQILGTNMKDFK